MKFTQKDYIDKLQHAMKIPYYPNEEVTSARNKEESLCEHVDSQFLDSQLLRSSIPKRKCARIGN